MDSMKQGLQLLLHKVFHLINLSKSIKIVLVPRKI